MRLFISVFLVSILVFSQVVEASAPVFGTAAQTRYARQLTPPKGKALIYIYQPEQGGAVSPKLWLNNYEIGRIVPGSFTVWQLAPGKLELRVGGTEPARLSLMSQAGKVYLFRVSVTRNAAGARAKLDSLPRSYRSELAQLRYIKNPRQVSAPAMPPPAGKTVQKQASVPAQQAAAEQAVSAKPKPRPRSRRRFETALTPGGMAILLKLGSFSLSKQTQTILGSDRSFDKNASGVYAIEFDFQNPSGLAYGGELLGYKASFTTVGSSATGDVAVHAVLANIKQYYRTNSHLQPYIGAGLGIAVTDVTGSINGKTAGLAYQVLGGLEYRSSSIGVFAEAKYVGANTKDKNSQTIDASGSGIFAGLAFHF